MTNTPITGPFRILGDSPDTAVPWYMIPFDADGLCTAPQTRQMLINAVQNDGYTDIFLFSHGWNNTWNNAVAAYEEFMTGYARMVRDRGLAYPRPFRPLLVGVYWPSIELVRADELPPDVRDIETQGGGQPDLAIADASPATAFAADDVPSEQRPQFSELVSRDRLTEAEALQLAQLLLPTYQGNSGGPQEIPSTDAAISAQDLVDLWRDTLGSGTAGEAGPTATDATQDDAERGIIGDVLSFDPRDILRAVTIFKMKDRAGVVGVNGVGPLLADILAANTAPRVHLLGHSFGCRVVLSALCAQPLGREVNSALLLQPAVSCMCFADDVLDTGQPGGFRAAIDRVEGPILTTFSERDQPLHNFYHFAVRRPGDLGEIGGGRGLETPPDPHAALGGYGPVGCAGDCDDMTMPGPSEGYSLPAGAKVVGLNGTAYIAGHGDISNAATWWALYSQVAQ